MFSWLDIQSIYNVSVPMRFINSKILLKLFVDTLKLSANVHFDSESGVERQQTNMTTMNTYINIKIVMNIFFNDFFILKSTVFFSRWSDVTRKPKYPMLIGAVFEIAGNTMYFMGNSKWFLLASRLIAGL